MLLQELRQIYENRVEYAAKTFGGNLEKASNADNSSKVSTASEIAAELAKADPTKNKMYIVWITKMYVAGNFKMEDLERINKDIKSFERVKSKLENKDLTSYKTMDALYDAIEQFADKSDEDLMSNKQKVAALKDKEVEVFFQDGPIKVVIPKTIEASCLYGSGTKWCTTGKEQFDSYSSRGDLFIILAKLEGKDRKFQLHYEDDVIMDERDIPISKKDIDALSKLPAWGKYLNQMIKKHYSHHIGK